MITKGRPLAKAGYESELSSIKGFVALQNKADGSSASVASDKVGILDVCLVWVYSVCECGIGV